MSVTCKYGENGPEMIYLKGAFEPVMERCTTYYVSDSQRLPLTPTLRDTINRHIAAMSSHGLRVLCMAFGTSADALCFTGFVAVYDPPRMGVSEAIRDLVQGGVKVVMITGDSDGTALSIARKLGIPMNPTRSCLTGQDIERMSERQLQEVIGSISVFARTTPRHKLAIVKAFQAKGGVVAMTGDGVNDAPALKMADIGISMGKSGTDVSKEAADMILVDDDFSTILSAVEEGKFKYWLPHSCKILTRVFGIY
jgi:Ca2+-transporting ATPase